MRRKQKRIKRAIKNTFLIITVLAAIVISVISFMGLVSMELTKREFAIDAIVFLLSNEYVFLFMWANQVFLDRDRVVMKIYRMQDWEE